MESTTAIAFDDFLCYGGDRQQYVQYEVTVNESNVSLAPLSTTRKAPPAVIDQVADDDEAWDQSPEEEIEGSMSIDDPRRSLKKDRRPDSEPVAPLRTETHSIEIPRPSVGQFLLMQSEYGKHRSAIWYKVELLEIPLRAISTKLSSP